MKKVYINYLSIAFKVSILFFFSFFLITCSASQHESGKANNFKTDWTAGQIKQKINNNSTRLRSFSAEGDISIDTPEMNNSGSLIISVNKPDSIFIKLEGPFGITAASMLITRKNFIYYNAMENVVYKGSSDPQNLSAILNFKINFDDMINSFTGSVIFDDTTSLNSTINKENDNLLLTVFDNKTNENKNYWIDPLNFYIIKYSICNKSKQVILEAEYSEYDVNDSIYFPGKIYINKPKDKQHVWLNYTDKTFNINYLNYKMKIPKSAKEINWN